jgi:hypothetical protein
MFFMFERSIFSNLAFSVHHDPSPFASVYSIFIGNPSIHKPL